MVSRLQTTIPAPARDLIRGFGVETIARLLEGLTASAIPMAVFDPDDRLVYFCPRFASLFAFESNPGTFSDMIRHCHATSRGPLIQTDDIDEWLSGARARRRSISHRRFEIDFVDGHWYQALETTYDDGWMLLVLVDLTAFKAKEADLTNARDAALQEAQTDFLTGLASRRAIMRYLETVIRAATPRNPPSIALLDFDHFKQINDTFGHDAGDDVLSHLGRHLASLFRNADRAGRVGGEEFLLVLPGTDANAARVALGRFRRHWLRASQLIPNRFNATFSAGIAQWQDGQTAGDLYRAADQALYRAKSAGRDRTVCADQAPAQLPATGT